MARQFRTLEDIRRELSDRLGFGGAAGAGAINAGILNSFLRNGQRQLWDEVDWHHLIKFADKTVGYGQNVIEYPTDCDPERILEVAVQENGYWYQLERSIEWRDRDWMEDADRPVRWEAFATMELYPKADREYPLKIKYVAALARFEQDNDRASLPEDLILLHALANGKAHYRHPDAPQYAGEFNQMLMKARNRAQGKRVFKRGRSTRVSDLDRRYQREVRNATDYL